MTLSEFKSWFEGFTESMKTAPNEKQWARIKARVKEINGTEITKTIYLDRYWNYPTPYWQSPYYGMGIGGSISGGSGLCSDQLLQNFNSGESMGALGKADFQAAT